MQSIASFGAFILMFFFASGAYVVWTTGGHNHNNNSHNSSSHISDKHYISRDHDVYNNQSWCERELDKTIKELSDSQVELVKTQVLLQQKHKALENLEKKTDQLSNKLLYTKKQLQDSLQELSHIRNAYFKVYNRHNVLKKEYVSTKRIAKEQKEKINILQPLADRTITAEKKLKNWQIGITSLILLFSVIAILVRLKKPPIVKNESHIARKKNKTDSINTNHL
ncbi:MAG: hypothetical protein MI974_28535 [Chitinophagales bacterium]|nr:hypothetical protein [Chitinophagales bacterium]